jgi:hypothetical protein
MKDIPTLQMKDGLQQLSNHLLVNKVFYNGKNADELQKIHYILLAGKLYDNSMYVDLAIELLRERMKDAVKSRSMEMTGPIVQLSSFIANMKEVGLLDTEVNDFYDLTDEVLADNRAMFGTVGQTAKVLAYLRQRMGAGGYERQPDLSFVLQRVTGGLRHLHLSELDAGTFFNLAICVVSGEESALFTHLFEHIGKERLLEKRIMLLWAGRIIMERTGKDSYHEKWARAVAAVQKDPALNTDADSSMLLQLLTCSNVEKKVLPSWISDMCHNKTAGVKTAILMLLCESTPAPGVLTKNIITVIGLSDN